MDVNEKIESATVHQLIRWWNGDDVPEGSQDSSLSLYKLVTALGRKGNEGIAFLRTQIEAEDLHKRYLALSRLAQPETVDERVIQCLVEAFCFPPSLDVKIASGFKILALDGLVRIGHYPLHRGEVETLLEDNDPWLAAAAMVYLSHAFEPEAVAILKAGLESDNQIMRGHACAEVGSRRILPLKGRVIGLLNDADDYVARAAQIACDLLDYPLP